MVKYPHRLVYPPDNVKGALHFILLVQSNNFMNLRFILALWVSKSVQNLMKILHRNATYLPGKLAIKICPDFLGHMQKPETVIGVTGTNGKTTVCNLLIDILTAAGHPVLANRFGSNINAGIASALMSGSTWSGKTRYPIGIFEIDERSSRLIYPYVKPDFLICTNLFRDSIRRNAHAEYIADLLSKTIPSTTKLILNADDAISSNICPENQRVTFGVDRLPSDLTECVNLICDAQICPKCSTKLQYDYLRYHHIGRVHCPNCGYHSPDPEYHITEINESAETIRISAPQGDEYYPMISNSLFNLYNELAVCTCLFELGWTKDQIQNALKNVHIVESRFSSQTVGGITVITHLAKGQNPVACSRVCDYVANQPGEKEIILVVDDVFDARSSSENIAWIYETDFEFLNRDEISRIVVGGVRNQDYLVRLLLAGIPKEKIVCVSKETDTPKHLLLHSGESVYILHELYAADLAEQLKKDVIDRIEKGVQA